MTDENGAPDAPRAMRLHGDNFDTGYLRVHELEGTLLLRFEAPPGRESVELVIRRDLLERQLRSP